MTGRTSRRTSRHCAARGVVHSAALGSDEKTDRVRGVAWGMSIFSWPSHGERTSPERSVISDDLWLGTLLASVMRGEKFPLSQ